MTKLLLSIILATSLSPAANAQESSRLSQSKLIGNKQFPDDPNLTDTKLRAEAGSVSRYSAKLNLSYSGPPIDDLSAKDQPNPDGTVGTYTTAITGTVGARYRLNSTSAVGVLGGIRMVHPFHGLDRTDLSNPGVSYDVSSKFGALQMKNTVAFAYRTVQEFTNIGQTSMLSYGLASALPLGNSRFSLGLEGITGFFVYSRDYQKKDGKAPLYSLLINPSVKYQFTDALSLETTVNVAYWSPRVTKDPTVLMNRSPSQRLGIGYALKKDIYFNPYLNFYANNLSLDTTTVNLAMIVSAL